MWSLSRTGSEGEVLESRVPEKRHGSWIDGVSPILRRMPVNMLYQWCGLRRNPYKEVVYFAHEVDADVFGEGLLKEEFLCRVRGVVNEVST